MPTQLLENTITAIIAVLFLRSVPGFVLARLSAVVPVILAAVLLAIPVDEAWADSGHPGKNYYPLHCAAGIDGDLAAVIHLLGNAHGKDVNEREPEPGLIFYLCSSSGFQTVYGNNTPLHHAVRHGHATIVATLIAAGADVNAKYGDKTPLPFAANQSVVSILIEAGGHWSEVCANAANPAGPSPPCLCESLNVGMPGECIEPSVESCGGLTPSALYDSATGKCECGGSAVLNSARTGCLCEFPNVGTPEKCVEPSAESCEGLTPPQFYDSAAGECAEFKSCLSGAALNRDDNICECAGESVLDEAETGCLCESPNVGTGGNCAAPSEEVCGGLTPPQFYDSAAGECAEFKMCLSGATLNRGANICECAPPSVLDGAGLGCEFTL